MSYINNINTIEDLFEAAKRSSCPESGGVVWSGTIFEPGSCMIDDQFLAEEFNDKLLELLNNINKGENKMRDIKKINKKEYYKMVFIIRVFRPILYIMALPFILLEVVLRKLGVLNAATNIISRVFERIANKRHAKREKLIKETTDLLHCKNIDTYPSFWMGETCSGSYFNGLIKLNAKARGIHLVETMFHEDRHFQQEVKNHKCWIGYIRAEDDYRGYIRQHVEKDARRYAYVQTMRYAKVRLGIRFYLFAPLYRMSAHPWKGIALKKYR